MSVIRRNVIGAGLPCDERPVGLWCFGCGQRFVPKGTEPNPVPKDSHQWLETLCDDPDCLANDIIAAPRARKAG